ncbi:Right handed beta helix region [Chitinophaga sp. CF118]|uniref:right-handed parallel beta-helix repeat-containing protein n=1 Tax=Chitinophaga sp. CF118 TaxID=1884367 RepID=UPI0008ECC322|nr:right-handed parallel beta-helix repeat-containing protein [Chitinophaga sp. CF118]SFD21240.1 Right handed beta helix region [Chitinophaga sp. CF118]
MKTPLAIMLLAVVLSSCGKNTQLAPELTERPLTTAALVNVAAVSVTVTTESALKAAIAAAAPGDIITISGTIKLTSTLQCLKSGTSSAKINFTGGTLDCSGITSADWGVKVNGSYWNITNMTIKNAPDCGLVFQTGGNNYVNNVKTTGNKDTGIQVYNGAYNVSVNNCTSSGNNDSQNAGENADGFACKLSGGSGNQFNGCTATSNADDGFDLYGQQYPVKITGSTANSNGIGANGDGNGFKLGSSGLSVAHTITSCSASNNKPGWGFTRNGNAKGVIKYSGLTGSGNGAGLSDL